jgi:hypothetical protein
MCKKGSEGSEGSVLLTEDQVLEELDRKGSGTQRTAQAYLAGETKIEYVAKAVLFAKGKDTNLWEPCASVVEEALAEWGEAKLSND